MAFEIKDQTKAAAALRGNFAIYGLILFFAWRQPIGHSERLVTWRLQSKAKQRGYRFLGKLLNIVQCFSLQYVFEKAVLLQIVCEFVQNTFNYIFLNHMYNNISVKIRTVQSKAGFMRYFSLLQVCNTTSIRLFFITR